jgi:biopolymer transport protein ExbB
MRGIDWKTLILGILLFITTVALLALTKTDPMQIVADLIAKHIHLTSSLISALFACLTIWMISAAWQSFAKSRNSNFFDGNSEIHISEISQSNESSDSRLARLQGTVKRSPTVFAQTILSINKAKVDEVESSVHRHFRSFYEILEPIRLVSVIAPSLGFLGTAVGMVYIFSQFRSETSLNRHLVLAQGIQIALITTILGLILRIIALYIRSLLFERLRNRQKMLQEKIVSALGLDTSSSKGEL